MKTYHAQAWTPAIAEIANKLINEIHYIAPELQVLFMGAAALELPGKNDIDIDILCPLEKVSEYTNKLTPLLGDPTERTHETSTWIFYRDGFEVDAILSDPTISHVPEQRKVFEILRSNPDLLNEYRSLKISWDGIPYSEYEKRKVEFFKKRILVDGG